VTRLGWLTYDDFAGRVGERFEVVTDGAAVLELVLREATCSDQPGGAGPDGRQRLQFSLVFRGPRAPVLPQGTYPLAHDELEDLELFLVPIGPDAEGMQYEAVFA
jgi:hypothetical protein